MAVIQNGAYKERSWVLSVLSFTAYNFKHPLKPPVPYQAVRKDEKGTKVWMYYNPALQDFDELEGADPNFPVARPEDHYTFKAGEIPGITEDTDTTFGRLLVNAVIFFDVLKERAPYINGEINRKVLEKIYDQRLADGASEHAGDPKYLTVDEFKRCMNNGFSLGGLSPLCVPTACPETMYPPKFIIELRDKLFAENQGKLNDPAVMGMIQQTLLKEYRAYLMTTPSKKFFIFAKTIDDSFNKMFLTGGIETAFGNNVVIQKSLYEGWDLKKFPAYVNKSVSASFDRGASTADGGEKVKMLIRATQNILIQDEDCGTTLGVPLTLTPALRHRYLGAYVIADGVSTHLDQDNIDRYVGQDVVVRSPAFCKLSHGDSCKYCAGSHNSTNNKSMSSGASKIGSKLMLLSMKSMHKGSRITLVDYDLDEAFN